MGIIADHPRHDLLVYGEFRLGQVDPIFAKREFIGQPSLPSSPPNQSASGKKQRDENPHLGSHACTPPVQELQLAVIESGNADNAKSGLVHIRVAANHAPVDADRILDHFWLGQGVFETLPGDPLDVPALHKGQSTGAG